MTVAWHDVVPAAEALVRRRTGLVFGGARRAALEGALAKGMKAAGLVEPDRYLARLDVEAALLDDLVAEITVGESYFFREPEQFRLIREEVMPALAVTVGRNRPLRVWSAGCAGGEEPYTLAIVIRELGLSCAVHILATDLSRGALTRARRGSYSRWALRGVADQVVREHFESRGAAFTLLPVLRGAVEFRYLNLADHTYPSLVSGIWGMDLILCRNVLIYLDAETVARVAHGLLHSLSDDGWLLLGASDPMLTDLVPCDVVVTHAGLAYRRPRRDSLRPTPVVAAPRADPAPVPVAPTALDVPASLAVAPEAPPAVAAAVPTGDDAADAIRLYATGDYARAAELAGRVIGGGGEAAATWIVLIRALANRGALEAAGRACATALDRHPLCAELAYLHALLLAEADHTDEAVAAGRRALYLDRDLIVAHLALGAALARANDVAAAVRAFRNAEHLLRVLPATAPVPGADGELAGRLADMAGLQRALLDGTTT